MDIAKITFKDGTQYYVDESKWDDETFYAVRKLVRKIPSEDIYEPCTPERLETIREHLPESLKGCASELGWIAEADGIRQYFDTNSVFDSYILFNLFATLEEVAYEIEDGNYQKAEKFVRDYIHEQVKLMEKFG